MIESQIAYIVDALRTVRDRGAQRVEVRAEVQDAFLDEMARAQPLDTVWLTGGCDSYYTDRRRRQCGSVPELEFRIPAAHQHIRCRRPTR